MASASNIISGHHGNGLLAATVVITVCRCLSSHASDWIGFSCLSRNPSRSNPSQNWLQTAQADKMESGLVSRHPGGLNNYWTLAPRQCPHSPESTLTAQARLMRFAPIFSLPLACKFSLPCFEQKRNCSASSQCPVGMHYWRQGIPPRVLAVVHAS
eukprot:5727473-Amphidinium_carterae.1